MLNLIHSVAGVIGPGDKAMGTAFFVSPQVLVTCTHVLRDIGIRGPLDGIPVALRLNRDPALPQDMPQTTLWARVAEWRDADEEDLAILELSEFPPRQVVPLLLGRYSHPTSLADSYGFPAGFGTDGVAAAFRVDSMGLHNGRYAALLSNADTITWGCSGAPVVDRETHQVIGIAVCIFLPDAAQRFRNSGYMIPIEVLYWLRPDFDGRVECPYDVKRRSMELIGTVIDKKDIKAAIESPAHRAGLWFQSSDLPQALADEIAKLRPPKGRSLPTHADGGALLLAEIVGWRVFTSNARLMLTRPSGGIEDMIVAWAESQFKRVISKDNIELATRIVTIHTNDPTRFFIHAVWRLQTMDSERIELVRKALLDARILVKVNNGDITTIDPSLATTWPRVRAVIQHWQTKLKIIALILIVISIAGIAVHIYNGDKNLHNAQKALRECNARLGK